ncbi:hypothetical protein TRVA0_021S00716 [Trichomonascus vanleenenianus]|uniref:uncharacterized protein n=1 Tax=Trichomonascus vanleenenianus TaxID=2268995 RepID=UPI003ECA1409
MVMMTTYNADSIHQYIAIPQDTKLEPIVMKEVESGVVALSQGKQSSLSLLLQQSKHYSTVNLAVDATNHDYSSGVTSASEVSSLATSPILNQPTPPKEQDQQQPCCLTFNCPKPEKSLSRVKINRYQFTPPPPSNMLSFDSDEEEDEDDREYNGYRDDDDDDEDDDDNDFDDNDNEFVMD